jgi:hypothetical protein
MDLETYNDIVKRQPGEAQAIYWREMILRIHLASCSALRRHGEWLRSLVMAVEEECLFGAFASYRGFLESAADSFYSLGAVPTSIAPNMSAISSRLRQKSDKTKMLFVSEELENRLIHFSHARKLDHGESTDPVHAAKQIREYLNGIERAGVGVKGVHALYSELCGITHPSAESVGIWYEAEKGASDVVWRRHNVSPTARFKQFLGRWKATSEGVINVAFVPAFMALRILHKFDFLPKIPKLKSFPFDTFPVWRQIERQINK